MVVRGSGREVVKREVLYHIFCFVFELYLKNKIRFINVYFHRRNLRQDVVGCLSSSPLPFWSETYAVLEKCLLIYRKKWQRSNHITKSCQTL